MAKQVIVLSVDAKSSPAIINVRYLLWLTTPSPVPAPNFISQWTGIAPQETTDIQAGKIIEEGYNQPFPSTLNHDQIETFLLAHYQARQTFLALTVQPGAFYGTFYDSGTGWSA